MCVCVCVCGVLLCVLFELREWLVYAVFCVCVLSRVSVCVCVCACDYACHVCLHVLCCSLA